MARFLVKIFNFFKNKIRKTRFFLDKLLIKYEGVYFVFCFSFWLVVAYVFIIDIMTIYNL
jgi:hypothetical protein